MREVPKSGPLVLKGESADPPDPPGYGPVNCILLSYNVPNKIPLCLKYFLHFANYSKK